MCESEGNVGLWGSQRGCKSKCNGYLLFHWEKWALLRCEVRQLRAVPGLAGLSPGPAGTPRPRGGRPGAGAGVSLCNNWLLHNGL